MYFSLRNIFVTIIIVFAFTSSAIGQWSLSQLNLTHQHNPDSELFANVYSEVVGDSIHVVFDFTINKQDADLNDYFFDLFLEKSVSSKLNQPLLDSEVDSVLLQSMGNKNRILFKAPYNLEKYAILRVLSSYSNYSLYFETVISPTPGIKVFDRNIVLYEDYITPGQIRNSVNLIGFYYKQEFEPAVAPMVTSSDLPSKELVLDSTWFWPQGTSQYLKSPGLYLFQADTTSNIGKGLRVESKYFPKLASLEELIKPLVYITTNEEYADLTNTINKVSFDKFWLSRTDTPGKAKELIKEYYDRVETSNRFYTSYKQGWKTDMGMIYIIFGPPDEVIKTSQGENWVYLSDYRFPKITYEFIKADTIFSSSHYVLIRKKNYDAIWIRAVELWRRGKL